MTKKMTPKQALMTLVQRVIEEETSNPYRYTGKLPGYSPILGQQALKVLNLSQEAQDVFLGLETAPDYDYESLAKTHGLEELSTYLNECFDGKYTDIVSVFDESRNYPR